MSDSSNTRYDGSCGQYFDYVREAFSYLLEDHGYEWNWNNEEPLAFNNCAVIIQSKSCALHILRNRGFTELEISTPANVRSVNKRHSLYGIMDKLDISTDGWLTYDEIRTDEDEMKQIEYYAGILRNNLEAIEKAITTLKG